MEKLPYEGDTINCEHKFLKTFGELLFVYLFINFFFFFGFFFCFVCCLPRSALAEKTLIDNMFQMTHQLGHDESKFKLLPRVCRSCDVPIFSVKHFELRLMFIGSSRKRESWACSFLPVPIWPVFVFLFCFVLFFLFCFFRFCCCILSLVFDRRLKVRFIYSLVDIQSWSYFPKPKLCVWWNELVMMWLKLQRVLN